MGTLYDPVHDDLASLHIKDLILSPELWKKFDYSDLTIDYTKWEHCKMLDSSGELHPDINNIPKEYGGIYVYAIVPKIIPNCGSYIMYVGKATKTKKGENLRARVKSYKKQFGVGYNRSKLHTLFTKYGEYVYVYYLPIDSSDHDITELEDRLIAAHGKPPCNKEVRIKSVKTAIDAVL